MPIIKCRLCRRSFQGFSALCPNCVEQIDKKYILVRNYLDKNRYANLAQVADDTGVDQKSLLYLIREGRLSLRGEGGDGSITCLKCGAAIDSGKYCEKCKGDLVHELEHTISEMETKGKPAQPKPGAKPEPKSGLHVLRDD